ncbi:MAG: helix-turn-helix domain-containing protein, partial [Terriglobales bacterium]
AARAAGIPALAAEVAALADALEAPAARLVSEGEMRVLALPAVENLLASPALVVDACRRLVQRRSIVIPLATRPVLFALVRALAEAWPSPASRTQLLSRAFAARLSDASHRARLRVEIARLRRALREVAAIRATDEGFVLEPRRTRAVAVLAPPGDDEHAAILALLADCEAWSSSALALALNSSQRSVQRALESLLSAAKVRPLGRARARRWLLAPLPALTTILSLPVG